MSPLKVQNFNSADIPQLCEFLLRWSPRHPELARPELHNWQHCKNRWVVKEGEQIVGYMGQIRHPFYKNGQYQFDLGFGVTLVLDESNPERQKHVGRALLSQAESNGVAYAGLGVVPQIEGAYQRRGHIIRRDCVNMYARFNNPGKGLNYLHRSGIHAPGIALGNLIFPIPKTAQYCNYAVDCGDETLSYKNPAYLKYKMSQPGREYHKIVDPKSCDYIVFRFAKHGGLLFQRICHITTRYIPTMSYLLQRAVSKEADVVVAIDSQAMVPVYRGAGMWLKKAYPFCLPPSITDKVIVDLFDADLDDLW